MTDFSEWFHNILEEAEIIDSRYPIKGMHVWLPQGFKLRKHTLNILKNLLDKEHEEVLFPLLVPEDELAKEAIHVKGFEEEVYWVTHGGLTELNKKLALRPTSETAMYPMFSLWVRSHTDLPMKFYQVVNTFRYETKHTRPLIRVREITTFKEAHTIHKSSDGAEKQVLEALSIYKKFFDILAIPYVITKRPVWDKFPGADYTMAFDTLMPDGKTLQIGTVHNLGQTFAKTFEITFENSEGDHEYVYQTCYGLSDRVIASAISVHGDESGLCLPPDIAPYQIVIVPIIFKKGGEEVINKCREIENELVDEGFRVKFDDRDIRAGKKFYEWEMRGVPLRIEIGPRDLENNNAVFLRRDNMEKTNVSLNDDIISSVKDSLSLLSSNMKDVAWERFNNQIKKAETVEDARDEVESNQGIISFSWCGDEDCGKAIEEQVRVDILGIQEDEESGNCINCGKKAKHKALLAKTY
ncbi:proline--tRNA ligase [Methanobacterium alcaliphilum]|uniref:proline--tRNA ligase n=1 Tax=Methanobacterium alcaliphilum TaxID=392018 RepID=UPI00200AE461|nr:proline--tRNA ligase [Methanobacterium alcaliphilum]MCK9152585.1 proline--tRNA ligase [Methanobacterium alcaliphilum]